MITRKRTTWSTLSLEEWKEMAKRCGYQIKPQTATPARALQDNEETPVTTIVWKATETVDAWTFPKGAFSDETGGTLDIPSEYCRCTSN